MKPILLDTFCGAGGAGYGYHLAGFEVVGVDINPQPRYPFEFHQGDALEFIAEHGKDFDVIHASPPCQAYSKSKAIKGNKHPEMVDITRDALIKSGKHFVIENVPGAPLVNPLMLCGSMFPGLRVRRHRLFEIDPPLYFPPATCNHSWPMAPGRKHYHRLGKRNFITCVAHNFAADAGRQAMNIPWMIRDELSQAIPPAYTEWIGKQLIKTVLT